MLGLSCRCRGGCGRCGGDAEGMQEMCRVCSAGAGEGVEDAEWMQEMFRGCPAVAGGCGRDAEGMQEMFRGCPASAGEDVEGMRRGCRCAGSLLQVREVREGAGELRERCRGGWRGRAAAGAGLFIVRENHKRLKRREKV